MASGYMAIKDPELMTPVDFPVEFGRYTLTGLLGEGGMGRVFRAKLRGGGAFEKEVAVKVVRTSALRQNMGLAEGLENEARIGALLTHPHIVATNDYAIVDGHPMLAMELLRGLSLDALLSTSNSLKPRHILQISQQVADGLHAAHEFEDGAEGVSLVHRDMKPSNIFVTRNGVAKVLDLGIAKASEGFSNQTQTGFAKGSFGYMSPEQFSAAPLDGRSDIFSLGAVLYEMVMGTKLFAGTSQREVLTALWSIESRLAESSFTAAINERIPGLGEIIHKCLRDQPNCRYVDAAELSEALQLLMASVPTARRLSQVVREAMTDGGEALTDRPGPLTPAVATDSSGTRVTKPKSEASAIQTRVMDSAGAEAPDMEAKAAAEETAAEKDAAEEAAPASAAAEETAAAKNAAEEAAPASAAAEEAVPASAAAEETAAAKNAAEEAAPASAAVEEAAAIIFTADDLIGTGATAAEAAAIKATEKRAAAKKAAKKRAAAKKATEKEAAANLRMRLEREQRKQTQSETRSRAKAEKEARQATAHKLKAILDEYDPSRSTRVMAPPHFVMALLLTIAASYANWSIFLILLLVWFAAAAPTLMVWNVNTPAFLREMQNLIAIRDFDRAVRLADAAPGAHVPRAVRAMLSQVTGPGAKSKTPIERMLAAYEDFDELTQRTLQRAQTIIALVVVAAIGLTFIASWGLGYVSLRGFLILTIWFPTVMFVPWRICRHKIPNDLRQARKLVVLSTWEVSPEEQSRYPMDKAYLVEWKWELENPTLPLSDLNR